MHHSTNPPKRRAQALLIHRGAIVRSPPIAATVTEIVTTIEGIKQRISADLRQHGIIFGDEHLLSKPTVQDTLRFEIARALDGERVQLMIMHHAFDAETVITSVDQWLERWPQRMAVYVDVNRYVN